MLLVSLFLQGVTLELSQLSYVAAFLPPGSKNYHGCSEHLDDHTLCVSQTRLSLIQMVFRGLPMGLSHVMGETP